MVSLDTNEKMMKDIAISFMELAKKKHYRKISVSEIMKSLHVTRQSFYYYFEDIDHLIDWINIQTLEQPFRSFHATKDLEKANEMALTIYVRDRLFFRNVLSFMGEGPFEISIYNKFREGMMDHLGYKRLTDDELFSANVYLKGIIQVYIDIIKKDDAVDIKKVANQLCKAMPQNLIKYYDFKQFEVRSRKEGFWN